eukprot:4970419-Lingulodinium_polyedra.AAC.1
MLIIGLVRQVVFAPSCQGLLQVRAIVRQLVRGQHEVNDLVRGDAHVLGDVPLTTLGGARTLGIQLSSRQSGLQIA